MKTASDFFHAINEATRIKGLDDPSEDAIEFLQMVADHIFNGLDLAGAVGRDRDNRIFWDGMLKGVQLRLSKDRIREKEADAINNRLFSQKEN